MGHTWVHCYISMRPVNVLIIFLFLVHVALAVLFCNYNSLLRELLIAGELILMVRDFWNLLSGNALLITWLGIIIMISSVLVLILTQSKFTSLAKSVAPVQVLVPP
jgi:phosphoglycerol transferase MdoB-like AlkP superfamily enzyme